jgi:hypothetical protein
MPSTTATALAASRPAASGGRCELVQAPLVFDVEAARGPRGV